MKRDCFPCKQQDSFEEAHNSIEAVNGQDPNDARERAGLIFMCDDATKMDCFKYRVMGLSKKKKNLMDVITKGMRLFLFDVKLKVMYGIYVASSDGGFNLEPDAFGGNFPWQVKFQIENTCIPLSEDVFKTAIKDNYFACRKFKAELTSEQVQKLIKLFSPLPLFGPSILGSCRDTEPCTRTPDKRSPTTYNEASKSDAPVQILYQPTPPLLDGVAFEKCIYDHSTPRSVQGFPQCIPACAHHMLDADMDNHQSSCELVDPAKSIVTTTCMFGFRAPRAQHEHIHRVTQQGLVGRSSDVSYNEVATTGCMHSIFAPGIQEQDTCVADKACTVVESLPSYSRRHMCGSSASLNSVCGCMQNQILPSCCVKEISWDGKCCDEPVGECTLACSHASVSPRAGVSYVLPGHACRAIGHKRPLQEMLECTRTEAPGASFKTCGGRPITCIHHQALE